MHVISSDFHQELDRIHQDLKREGQKGICPCDCHYTSEVNIVEGFFFFESEDCSSLICCVQDPELSRLGREVAQSQYREVLEHAIALIDGFMEETKYPVVHGLHISVLSTWGRQKTHVVDFEGVGAISFSYPQW